MFQQLLSGRRLCAAGCVGPVRFLKASSNDIAKYHVPTNVTEGGTGPSVYGNYQTTPYQTAVIKYKFTACRSFPVPVVLLMITRSVGAYLEGGGGGGSEIYDWLCCVF